MSKLSVALALDLSLQHISRLVDMVDAFGVCQRSKTLREAREFGDELLEFARHRRCCHNCAYCRPDDGALHVGRTDDPFACWYETDENGGRATYIPENDPGAFGMHCHRFTCKYEGGKVK